MNSQFFTRSNSCNLCNKTNKFTLLMLSFVFLTLLGGCSRYYIPKAFTYPLDPIPEFLSKHSVALINSQTSTKEHLYGKRHGKKYYSNYQAWTNTAIKIVRRELSNRDMTISNDSQKLLKLSVESVQASFKHWATRIEVRLRVETSDGLVKVFSGNSRSAGGLYRASDGAVMRVVTQMLRDEEIVAYLKQ